MTTTQTESTTIRPRSEVPAHRSGVTSATSAAQTAAVTTGSRRRIPASQTANGMTTATK